MATETCAPTTTLHTDRQRWVMRSHGRPLVRQRACVQLGSSGSTHVARAPAASSVTRLRAPGVARAARRGTEAVSNRIEPMRRVDGRDVARLLVRLHHLAIVLTRASEPRVLSDDAAAADSLARAIAPTQDAALFPRPAQHLRAP